MGKPKQKSNTSNVNASKKKKIRWNKESIQQALSEIRNGSKIRAAAKKYGMDEGTLRYRLKLERNGKSMVGSGRRPTLNEFEEKELAKCIHVLCNLGFSPSTNEIKDLVRDYVVKTGVENPFKHDRPGKDWLCSFMERQRLSMKKATMISAARNY